MLYDLNVPWPTTSVNPQQSIDKARNTAADLAALGFHTLAFNQTVTGAFSNQTECLIPDVKPPKWKADALHIMTSRGITDVSAINTMSRVTFVLEDQAQVSAIAQCQDFVKKFDIVAVTPTSDKLWMAACQTIDCDIISLDMSQRLPFVFKHSIVGEAIRRGIVFEIAYSAAFRDNTAKRNLISNATNLLRVTKGKNVILSSGAKTQLEARGPWIGCLFGLNQDSAKHCISTYCAAAIVHAQTRGQTHKAAASTETLSEAQQAGLAFMASGLGSTQAFIGMGLSDEDADSDDAMQMDEDP
ncbi:RNase P subunit p30-domain-containing protein [Catenaria anguillulae PL171]|uniref:RNase P subunit p30-domain-containing protein n=1 Tax=Catenaria anguillulae PL171 TaxID=765915 RepID=A0A1Y2HAS0_9FUNG|nr:RNase P subunit p30-domain-containing protein [Catenaria anguillulae PL171]